MSLMTALQFDALPHQPPRLKSAGRRPLKWHDRNFRAAAAVVKAIRPYDTSMPSPPTYSSANVRSLQTRLASAVAHWTKAFRAVTRDKLAMFVILGGVAAFVGSMIGYNFRKVPVVRISLWDAAIGICLAAALTLAQNLSLKRLERGMRDVWRFGRRGAIAGAAGGAAMVAAQVLMGRGPLAMTIAWAVETASWPFSSHRSFPTCP